MVWEITHRCDLRCAHCLVEGGPTGRSELDTAAALDLCDQLASLGARIVTLTGGEPLVRRDWRQLAERVVDRAMQLRLSTNGHLLDDPALSFLQELGCEGVVVSVDGLAETHDRLRHGPRPLSSHGRVLDVLDRLAPSPIRASVITSVTAQNLAELPLVHTLLKDHGVQSWQVQLAHPTGRGGASVERLMAPAQLPQLIDYLVSIVDDPVLPPRVHNTIGYLGRDEPRLRSSGRKGGPAFWKGCRCGVTSMGIEPDGGIKGCASQVGSPFVVGHAPAEALSVIWSDRTRWHWLDPTPDRMAGDCRPCALKAICKAGCTALAWGSSGELFSNPYCERTERGLT